MHQHLSLKYICRLFGKSRQGWHYLYQHQDEKSLRHAIVLELVHQIRAELPRLGVIKLHFKLTELLKDHHFSIGRDSLFKLLRVHGLLIKNRRKYAVTTNSNHNYRIWSDLVNRKSSHQPEEIWVSDITYIRMSSGFAYLSLVTDAYSRKIVGYHLSRNLKAAGCISALKMAINSRLYPQRPLIHHSDRGVQYCCEAYIQLLQNSQMKISMTQTGSPYDNALAERINGILKAEFKLGETFKSFALTQEIVQKAIEIYNTKRPHFSCEMQTPQFRHANKVKNSSVKPDQENKSST